jgi:hypothetical protein
MSNSEGKMRSAGIILTMSALAAASGFSGCANDTDAVAARRMPTASAVAAPEVAPISSHEALAGANAAATRNDFPSIMRAVEMAAPSEQISVVRQLITDVAQVDLAKAELVTSALPSGRMQSEATDILVRMQMERASQSAVQWAVTTVTPAIASRARQKVAERLVTQDPNLAMAKLLALPASSARQEMIGYAAAEWAQRDARSALTWVQSQHSSEENDRMMTSIGFALAQSDPASAVPLLDRLPAGRDRMAMITAIGQTWIARDEQAAWKWANQLPSGSTQEAAFAGIETGLGGAGSHLAQNDTRFIGRTAAAGLNSTRGGGLPPMGVAREDALRRKFEEALHESPVRAADWLATLPSSDRRDDMISDLVRRWLPLNPDAAKMWVDQNVPNPARREELLREAGRLGY